MLLGSSCIMIKQINNSPIRILFSHFNLKLVTKYNSILQLKHKCIEECKLAALDFSQKKILSKVKEKKEPVLRFVLE